MLSRDTTWITQGFGHNACANMLVKGCDNAKHNDKASYMHLHISAFPTILDFFNTSQG